MANAAQLQADWNAHHSPDMAKDPNPTGVKLEPHQDRRRNQVAGFKREARPPHLGGHKWLPLGPPARRHEEYGENSEEEIDPYAKANGKLASDEKGKREPWFETNKS